MTYPLVQVEEVFCLDDDLKAMGSVSAAHCWAPDKYESLLNRERTVSLKSEPAVLTYGCPGRSMVSYSYLSGRQPAKQNRDQLRATTAYSSPTRSPRATESHGVASDLSVCR